MTIETFDPHQASEAVLHGVHQVLCAVEAEDFPDDPPLSFEARKARMLAPLPVHNQMFRWLVREGDEVLATSWGLRWPDEDPDNSLVSVAVLPHHRRQGLGAEMLTEALVAVEAEGSRLAIVDCVDGRPWEPALKRIGFESVFNDRQSRLYLADVDWDLMDRWIARAAERASDYELITLSTPYPDEHLENVCQVQNVMNTAPLEGLELADRIMTPNKWRSIEAMLADRGDTMLAVFASHTPTGRFVGYTDVTVHSLQPHKAHQNDTGVDPEHRNKGLGRWVKATMAMRVLDEYPGVASIDTSNAGSNAPMLAINVAMGFKPILQINAWQGEIATVRANLS